jgi:hypothetical protein
MTGTLHKHQYKFLIIFRLLLLRMMTISDQVIEKIKTHVLWSITDLFPRKLWRLWDHVGKCYKSREARDGNIIRRMRIACWINKAKNAHSKLVIFIGFPRRKWLSEPAAMLDLYVCFLSCFTCSVIVKQSLKHIDKQSSFTISFDLSI